MHADDTYNVYIAMVRPSSHVHSFGYVYVPRYSFISFFSLGFLDPPRSSPVFLDTIRRVKVNDCVTFGIEYIVDKILDDIMMFFSICKEQIYISKRRSEYTEIAVAARTSLLNETFGYFYLIHFRCGKQIELRV